MTDPRSTRDTGGVVFSEETAWKRTQKPYQDSSSAEFCQVLQGSARFVRFCRSEAGLFKALSRARGTSGQEVPLRVADVESRGHP